MPNLRTESSSPSQDEPKQAHQASAVEIDETPKSLAGSAVETIRGFFSRNQRLSKAFLWVWTAIGACVLVGATVYLLSVLAIPVSLGIWTTVFVFCLRGVVAKLEQKGVPRIAGTTISYVLMFLLIALVLFLMFSPMFGLNAQFANIIESIPGYIDEIREWSASFYDKYATILNEDNVRKLSESVESSFSSWASSMASGAAGLVVDAGTTIANSFTAIGFALVIAFWILLELPAMGKEANRLLSDKHRQTANFLHITFTKILGGYIKGTLIQCFIIGVACGVLFAVVGVPNAPAMGVITGVMNIIPIIGPWLGGIGAAISAVFASPIKALIALIGTIVIQQFVYTFVSPKIMSNSVNIHPVLTLTAMLIGSAIGGAMSGMVGSLVGMLLSIPACAVIKSCFVYFFERSTHRQIVAEDGFLFMGTPSKDTVDPMYDATGAGSPEKHKGAKGKDADDDKGEKGKLEHAKSDLEDRLEDADDEIEKAVKDIRDIREGSKKQ